MVAIDADINQHLADALVASQPSAMGAHLPEIKEYLRGSNPRISSAAAMVKTTPPGRGSRPLRRGGPDPVPTSARSPRAAHGCWRPAPSRATMTRVWPAITPKPRS